MSDYLRIRISEELKTNAEAMFRDMGMTISEAVRIFIQQSVNCGGLPFTPRGKTPNAETLRSFKEYEEGKYTSMTYEEFKSYLDSVAEEVKNERQD